VKFSLSPTSIGHRVPSSASFDCRACSSSESCRITCMLAPGCRLRRLPLRSLNTVNCSFYFTRMLAQTSRAVVMFGEVVAGSALCIRPGCGCLNKGCTTQVSQGFVPFTQTYCFGETDLSRTYLAHHELESKFAIIIVLVITPSTTSTPPWHAQLCMYTCTLVACSFVAFSARNVCGTAKQQKAQDCSRPKAHLPTTSFCRNLTLQTPELQTAIAAWWRIWHFLEDTVTSVMPC